MGEFLLVVVLVVFYLLPSIVGNKKNNFKAIFTLNLLLGWTFIGWVVALVWAVSKDKEDVVIYKTESSSNVIEQIEGLKRLYDEGVITQSEFEEQKRRLLK